MLRLQPWTVRDKKGIFTDVILLSREIYDDVQVIADSAVAGGGLAWLSNWLAAPYVESESLKLVMDSDQVQPIDIHLIWPKTKYLPYRTRLLIN